jgi:hypothetical protein
MQQWEQGFEDADEVKDTEITNRLRKILMDKHANHRKQEHKAANQSVLRQDRLKNKCALFQSPRLPRC